MRDIREDLKDRLAIIEDERSRLQERISTLDNDKALVDQLLTIENTRWQKQPTQPQKEQVRTDVSDLPNYLTRLLADGNEWHRRDITNKAVSDGYLRDSGSPGRSVHLSLVNLKKRGLVEQIGKGTWKKATASKAKSADDAAHDLLS